VLVGLMACTSGDDTGSGDQDGGGARLDAPGVEAGVELVAPPKTGAGEVPTFEWRAVEGAAAYRLAVLNADGDVVWVWEGEETSIALGGVADRPEGSYGPVLTPGSTWSVVALDPTGAVVAVSEVRPVSP
jgi:hypothetical protein